MPGTAHAQADTLAARAFRLDEIVVVADRLGTPLRASMTATSLLTRQDLQDLPARTLPEVLRSLPGLVFVDRDGAGQLPMAVARGFFGGGETSYVLLTVDGVPVNDGRTGLVEWTQVPLSEIERIEVLRGSASEAYGDAALGAVVNIVTRDIASAGLPEGGLSLGSHESMHGWASASRTLGDGRLRASVDYDRDDGQRAHSASDRLGSSLTFRHRARDATRTAFGRLSFSRITNEEPGPLTSAELAADRTASHPAFGADDRTRSAASLSGGASRSWSGERRLDAAARFRWIDQERTRTLLLTPDFGDTQRLDDQDLSGWARVQYAAPVAGATLSVGGELEVAAFDTRYLSPESGATLSEGHANQTAVALLAGVRRPFGSRARLHLGIRYDGVLPRDEGAVAPESSFHQWSPRVAMNVAYSDKPESEGNVYASWTRAFKAPSLDQLFDARQIPTGEPGQTINISNAELRPQRSWSAEVGIYQRLPLGDADRFAELSVSVYRQDLEDEIDFDVRTYRYGNISSSRHAGAEASLRLALAPGVRVDHAATLTNAEFRSSDDAGNQLKNIPRTSFVTSVVLGVAEGADLTVTHRRTGRVWLDDENTESLEGTSLFDAAIRWRVGRVELWAAARNVLDTENETFGYLLFDPFRGVSERMVHPGPGRALDLQVTVRGR